jgi:hypothetical protein
MLPLGCALRDDIVTVRESAHSSDFLRKGQDCLP